jgi:hypothetical protein
VAVHLARESTSELDGPDLAAEGAAKRPFDEAGDPSFEVA